MIAIGYKCVCMPKEETLYVRARAVDEPIDKFMERVAEGVGDAHQELSPRCIARHLEYVRVPASETGIGHD